MGPMHLPLRRCLRLQPLDRVEDAMTGLGAGLVSHGHLQHQIPYGSCECHGTDIVNNCRYTAVHDLLQQPMAAGKIADLFARLTEYSHGALATRVARFWRELQALTDAAPADDPLSRSGNDYPEGSATCELHQRDMISAFV
jgi:hypothetical protein